MIKPFFTINKNDPKPLSCEIKRTIRFDELDPLNIVWHGNYASFFEEARVALGNKYGIGYSDFKKSNTIVPIKRMFVDYILPLKFLNTYTVKAILYYSMSPVLNISYEIYTQDNQLATRGYTIQLMTNTKGQLLLSKPSFFEEFSKKWKQGKIK